MSNYFKVQNIIMPNSANYNNIAVWGGIAFGNPTKVGTNGGPSAYGTYDQTGNVDEWNDLNGTPNSLRGSRGGHWSNVAYGISSAYRTTSTPYTVSSAIGFRLASSSPNALSYSSFVTVTDSGNSADTNSYGAVAYDYKIGTFLVTNTEYIEFLNAVAQTDTYGLYNTLMNYSRGGIIRSASPPYVYTTKPYLGNKPVLYASWFNCARYCNWLNNNKPTGAQNSTTTENGAYNVNGAISGNAMAVNATNPNTLLAPTYRMPTENEWYKAAYYKGGSTNAGYWTYATQSNVAPTAVQATPDGDGIAIRNFKIGTQNNVSYIITDDSDIPMPMTMNMVTVGDPGNAADTTGYGAVAYSYKIGKYVVTGSQYTAFLNAVGSTDTYGLYNASMGTTPNNNGIAKISRSGSSGSYTYAVLNGTGNRPITYVSWFDIARFANWMSNRQPSGGQFSTTTENGAYTLVNGPISGNAVAANATNPNTGLAPTYRIPLENEWYKAAYYSPNYGGTGVGGYYLYATQSDTAPGTTIGSSANQANYNSAIGTVTDVGSFSGSASFYGTFDQNGNVPQWNNTNGAADASRNYRGGMYFQSSLALQKTWRTLFHPVFPLSSEIDVIGFRLAGPV